MMHYILIFYMATWHMNDGGMTTFTAEFNNLQACQAAAEQVKQFEGMMSQKPKVLCVEKGDNK
jgi:ABC-type xylose transport system substrate-binding protein